MLAQEPVRGTDFTTRSSHRPYAVAASSTGKRWLVLVLVLVLVLALGGAGLGWLVVPARRRLMVMIMAQ